MKEFTKADLKPGMAVELRDGRYCLVIPSQNELLIAHVEGETLSGLCSVERMDDDMKQFDRVCKSYDVMKVYGLTANGGLLLCQSKDKRDLLWKRPVELKRCPFCGKAETAVLLNTYDDDDEAEFLEWRVVCSVHHGGCGASSGCRDSKQEAVEAWNRRAE